MSFNKSPLAFDDIRAIFDRAIGSSKGLKLPCATRGAAMNLRSRFNYYRSLDRKQSLETYEPGHPMHGRTVYDKLVLRIPARGDPEEATIFFEFRTADDFTIEEIT